MSATIIDFFQTHGIKYQKFDHPAVFTCEEAHKIIPNLPGAETKNLFLRDGKGRRHFLVAVSPEKKVDLRKLSSVLGVSGLGFASPERLKKYLGIDPGSVSLLGIINDTGREVAIVIDKDLWQAEVFLCHPLINTSTIAIAREDLTKFFELCGNELNIIDVPSV